LRRAIAPSTKSDRSFPSFDRPSKKRDRPVEKSDRSLYPARSYRQIKNNRSCRYEIAPLSKAIALSQKNAIAQFREGKGDADLV